MKSSNKLKTLRKEKGVSQEQITEQDIVEVATIDDIDEIENLYDDLNDYLETGVNYSGWKKGIYPVRETAIEGIKSNTLFIIRKNGSIAGCVVLNHEQDATYLEATWDIDAPCDKVMVVHTLSINPKYMKQGISKKLMKFVKEYSKNLGMKAIRLDVSVQNSPAIALYEKLGYTYIETIDLGLKNLDRVWFKLYEYKL